MFTLKDVHPELLSRWSRRGERHGIPSHLLKGESRECLFQQFRKLGIACYFLTGRLICGSLAWNLADFLFVGEYDARSAP